MRMHHSHRSMWTQLPILLLLLFTNIYKTYLRSTTNDFHNFKQTPPWIFCYNFRKPSKMYSTASPSYEKHHRFTVANVPKSMPLITTLLRASRNQDEELIKNVLQHIVTEGISVEDLNATDASGRVSILIVICLNSDCLHFMSRMNDRIKIVHMPICCLLMSIIMHVSQRPVATLLCMLWGQVMCLFVPAELTLSKTPGRWRPPHIQCTQWSNVRGRRRLPRIMTAIHFQIIYESCMKCI